MDYERGRTKKEWVPRRLGGGKGDKRRDRETERLVRELKKSESLLRSRSRSRDQENSTVKEPSSVKVKEEEKGASSEQADSKNTEK